MNEIKQLTSEDYEQVLALSQFAFQYQLDESALEKQKEWYGQHEMLGIYDGETLASKLHMVSLNCYLNNEVWKVGGLAAIATWPEYRRQGMAKDLMAQALLRMKEDGVTLSFLHPFSFSFYRRYGWDTLTSIQKYTIPMNTITNYVTKGTVKRVGQDIQLLNHVYEQFAKQYNGPLKRSEWWWKNRVFSSGEQATVWFNEQDEPRGFLIYHVHKKEMLIHEWIHLDEGARKGLLSFVRQHDSMARTVKVMMVPEYDNLSYLFDEPTFKQEIEPYFMARIVDVKSFLEKFSFDWGEEETDFFFHIKDDFAQWNTGVYRIHRTDTSKNEVHYFPQNKKKMACAHPPKRGLRCDIQTLTVLLLGYKSPSFLYELGKLEGKREEVKALEGRLSGNKTFFLDFF
ncbi:GNAT family N-acetyltransferase [Bacillus tianshenii]|nr:GNAT family N-acetyltransferase [Bacillus tianshenii]